jgi:hypothetical protein
MPKFHISVSNNYLILNFFKIPEYSKKIPHFIPPPLPAKRKKIKIEIIKKNYFNISKNNNIIYVQLAMVPPHTLPRR